MATKYRPRPLLNYSQLWGVLQLSIKCFHYLMIFLQFSASFLFVFLIVHWFLELNDIYFIFSLHRTPSAPTSWCCQTHRDMVGFEILNLDISAFDSPLEYSVIMIQQMVYEVSIVNIAKRQGLSHVSEALFIMRLFFFFSKCTYPSL